MRLRDTHSSQRGHTLVEMVMVIVILAILAGAGAMILKRGFDAYFGGENILTTDWQARLAFERMTRELRGAYSNPTLVVTGGTAIAFSYYDPVTVGITNVTYNLNGTTLQRIAGANTDALANSVSALTFALLKSDGVTPVTTSPSAETYYIQANMTVTTTAGTAAAAKGTYNLSFRDTINPRNFP